MGFTLKEAVIGLGAAVIGVSAYGMKWQMSQDEARVKMNELIIQQTLYLDMEQKIRGIKDADVKELKEKIEELQKTKEDKVP